MAGTSSTASTTAYKWCVDLSTWDTEKQGPVYSARKTVGAVDSELPYEKSLVELLTSRIETGLLLPADRLMNDIKPLDTTAGVMVGYFLPNGTCKLYVPVEEGLWACPEVQARDSRVHVAAGALHCLR